MSGRNAVHLFVGLDEFPMKVAARELIDRLIPEAEQAFGVETVDGMVDTVDGALQSIKRCREAVLTQGFLTTRGKVVWWKDVSFLADGQTGQSDDVRSELKKLASLLADTDAGGNVLLVTAPKMDRRSSFAKLGAEHFEIREFTVPEKAYQTESQARTMIRDGLKSRGLKADPAVEDLFWLRVGADSRQIANELDKLALFVGPRTEVTAADIEVIVSTSVSSVMWDLQDAVGGRDVGRALRLLHDLLANRESPIGIVVSLSSRIRDLMLYREALDRKWLRLKPGYRGDGSLAEWGDLPVDVEAVLAMVLRKPPKSIHPFAAGKLASQARNFTLPQLRRIQKQVAETHEVMVSSGMPQPTALECLLIRALGVRKDPPGKSS